MPPTKAGKGDEDLNRLQRIHEQVMVLLIVRHCGVGVEVEEVEAEEEKDEE